MRMGGRGQAPASFLLGASIYEVRGTSRAEARVVACSAVAHCADGTTTGSLYGRTGGIHGARSPLGSLVSTFGHFLRGTLSSDSLGTPCFLGFCSLYCPCYSASCARSAQKLLSPERVVPKSPVKARVTLGGPPFAPGNHEPALAALPLRAAKRALPLVPRPPMMHN